MKVWRKGGRAEKAERSDCGDAFAETSYGIRRRLWAKRIEYRAE